MADERIEGAHATVPLGERFWPLADGEREMLDTVFGQEDARALVSSLLAIEGGCKSPVRHCLIDVKEAVAAAAPRSADAAMPRDNGERVEGARHLSPHLGRRMLAPRLLDRAVFIRELLPQDLKLEIDALTRDEAMEVARYLAGVVGRARTAKERYRSQGMAQRAGPTP